MALQLCPHWLLSALRWRVGWVCVWKWDPKGTAGRWRGKSLLFSLGGELFDCLIMAEVSVSLQGRCWLVLGGSQTFCLMLRLREPERLVQQADSFPGSWDSKDRLYPARENSLCINHCSALLLYLDRPYTDHFGWLMIQYTFFKAVRVSYSMSDFSSGYLFYSFLPLLLVFQLQSPFPLPFPVCYLLWLV